MRRRHVLIGLGVGAPLLSAGLFGSGLLTRPDPFAGYVGQVAPDPPVQTDLEQAVLVEHPVADLILFAEFSLTALVLSSRTYRDELSSVAPVDLALAWGASSDPERIRDIEYWQHDRWYVYRSPNPISDEIRHSSSNMHMIPSDVGVEQVLKTIKAGNLIRLSGHLCDIRKPGKPEILSSRSRTDRDGGACEIVRIESLSVLS